MLGSTALRFLLLGLSLALSVACSRPLDRPLQGARPKASSEGATLAVEPPPTVSAPLPTPSPSPPPVIVLASPSPSPSILRDPILSGLLPAPNAMVAPGPVNIGARISASTNLTEVVLTLNGQTVEPNITEQSTQVWLIGYTSRLEVGRHEVRLNAKDREGRAGGYRWQFDVQPRPFASASPVPTRSSTPVRR
jgi:hypothetical protein